MNDVLAKAHEGMPLLFSMRHDFPDAWRRLITARTRARDRR
jgi:hypothetical protein